ncbi:MAG TPA: two-component system sensor histidine kinase CreC, partial [Agitococcus sp.]|nr:two-component system sensor histidine kinase CreC [Agitococcus sp.]
MSIFLRIWLVFSLVLVVGAYLTIKTLQEEIKPSVRQAIEDTLADNANIIAALVADDVKTGKVDTPEFREKIIEVLQRPLRAQIWQYQKENVAQHIYITNDKGIVLFDSQGIATGKDYSRWNDVRRTLDGKYGARTTRQDPQNELTSTMFVAAPIIDQQKIIGVVSVSKKSQLLQPFIERAQEQMLKQGLW